MIRRATQREASQAVAILRDVAAEYVERGMPLWDPSILVERDFALAADRGELVLGYTNARAVATMLLQRSDPLFWPDATAGEAFYLHKLAVLPEARGQGWGRRFIAWARGEALAAGARYLRLDTAPRAKLIGLYEGEGFALIDKEPRHFGDAYAVRLQLLL